MALPAPSPGTTCLVTGASSGIGADIARSLGQRGHGLTLVARRTDRLHDLADELRTGYGVRVETLGCDLADDASRAGMLEQLAELALEVDVLVNNAGFGSGGRFHELDPARELEMVRLNVEAVVVLCGHFVPRMVERGRGAVLNIASIAAFQPLPHQATYGATKAFVLSFTDSLHAELRGTGVTASALCPGPVETEFVTSAGIDQEAEWLPSLFWASSKVVAEEGVRALEKGRRVVVTGKLNRATALAGQHVPRGKLLRAAGYLNPLDR